MTFLVETWEALIAFFETGGNVVVAIFWVTLLMWILITERLLFMRLVFPREVDGIIATWNARADRSSWIAQQIRREMLSKLWQRLNRSVPMIKTLVAVCPLLGLLGTVTGMIEVFDIMAIAGSGNPRAMASGVSRATIPTMAGMVAALSGLYFSVRLDRNTKKETRKADDRMLREEDREDLLPLYERLLDEPEELPR
jgi:biopolymer transport protein ExbB